MCASAPHLPAADEDAAQRLTLLPLIWLLGLSAAGSEVRKEAYARTAHGASPTRPPL